jgi:hypothetical protein
MSRQAIQTRYLLGKLSDAESASLEERSFVDDNVFDEIEIAEDELIDAYVGDSLSAEDRERFENKLLQSERVAERVEFARLLSESRAAQVMVHEPAKKGWWLGFFDISFGANPALSGAAATALFLIVLALPVFVWMRMRFEGQLNLERAAIEKQRQDVQKELDKVQARSTQLDQDLQTSQAEEKRLQEKLQETEELLAQANRQSALLASISLLPGSFRDPGKGPLLRVSPTDRTIRLRLILDTEEDYDAYSARIISAANDNVLTSGVLKASRSGRSRVVNFTFAANKLPPGEYLVRVSGRTPSGTYEPIDDYSVRVVKK